jgi:gamma-glutamyltranspeptidase/glutathione hydrolase
MMKFDSDFYQFNSRRNVVYATKGMAATSQPLAAQAGLDILKKGGNAVDAAIATAAALTVVEPTSNGIGGDNFAIVWVNGRLHGMNSCGRSPKTLTREKLDQKGISNLPKHGFIPVTVPGAPGGWAALSERFGKLTLEEVLEPAISYARGGYPVSPVVARNWKKAFDSYKGLLKGEEYRHWFETFAPNGRAPEAGEIFRSEDHARTLETIAKTLARDFYEGEIAGKIDEYSRKYNGFIRKEDMAAFKAEWVEPISVGYRGYDIWELPPNNQGAIALMALNLMKGFELEARDSAFFHKQIEALKLAFSDGLAEIADPIHMRSDIKDYLSDEYAKIRRKLITEKAIMPKPGELPPGGTVYLATADGEGNMVSMIQSNYMGFGSGLVVPGTGIALHNRGLGFSMEKGHPNEVGPSKKPYHTIIPGFVTKDGKAVGPFGVMGAYMQPQGHLQVMMNSIDWHMNPQDALDAPRWQWIEGKKLLVEDTFPEEMVSDLISRGHEIEIAKDNSPFGRGEIIWRNDDGVLCGGTEMRADGCVAAW